MLSGVYWEGPWHVVYESGRSIGMSKPVALDYLEIFDDAKYVERVLKFWKWQWHIKIYKCYVRPKNLHPLMKIPKYHTEWKRI